MNRLAVFATVLCATMSVHAATVTFDFDNLAPGTSTGTTPPLQDSVGGVNATLEAAGSQFSIQNAATTFFATSSLSGNYLYPNSVSRGLLEIRFDQLLTNITLNFALIEFHDPGATPLRLTAYRSTNLTQPVGSVTVNAAAPGTGGVPDTDHFAQGVLSFDSAGALFDLVQLTTVMSGPEGGTGFLADNITVTTAEVQPIPEPATVALFAFGVALLTGLRRQSGRHSSGPVS
jgi:hypothetical protein